MKVRKTLVAIGAAIVETGAELGGRSVGRKSGPLMFDDQHDFAEAGDRLWRSDRKLARGVERLLQALL